MPPVLANILTLLAVMVGWTMFRASTLHQGGVFYAAMINPFASGAPVVLAPDVWLTAAVATGLVVAPRFIAIETVQRSIHSFGGVAFASRVGLAALFLVACARSISVPFQPFLYFRF
jgi:alginate O-acetyltransferase complex protein AlgI